MTLQKPNSHTRERKQKLTYENITPKQKKLFILLANGHAPSEIDKELRLTKNYTHDLIVDYWKADDLGIFTFAKDEARKEAEFAEAIAAAREEGKREALEQRRRQPIKRHHGKQVIKWQ